MNENINWSFVESMDKVIGKLAFADMLAAQPKNRKIGSKIKPYSLSQNTQYIKETKDNYVKGSITEEEAKAIMLRQKLCGNAI